MTSPLQDVQAFPDPVYVPTNSDPALWSQLYAAGNIGFPALVARTNALAAGLCGPGNAPPYGPVPFPSNNVGNGLAYGPGGGAQRIQQTLQTGSGLANVAGAMGDIVIAGLFGSYVLFPYSGNAPDGINIVNLSTTAAQGWTASTPYAFGELLYTASQFYFCSRSGRSANSGTGPSGAGVITDGAAQWTSTGNPQWIAEGFGRTVNVSAGSGDAGFLPRLNASGTLDPSFGPQNSASISSVFPTPANMYALVSGAPSGQQIQVGSGWTPSADAAIWRDNSGLVRMKGTMTCTSSAVTAAVPLPIGMRPAANAIRAFPCVSLTVVPIFTAFANLITAAGSGSPPSPSAANSLNIGPEGGSTTSPTAISAAATIYLDGISWLAEA